MKQILFILLLLFACSCDPGKIPPGEMRYIYQFNGYAVGTDSTIVLIGKNGQTVNTIKRK
jgi:hypothetical protein